MDEQIVHVPVKLAGLFLCQSFVTRNASGDASASASDINITPGRKENILEASRAQRQGLRDKEVEKIGTLVSHAS